jgi:hypothetical protein
VVLAAAHYAGYGPEVVCVDPFPTTLLVEAAREGEITLVSEPAQDVPISLLSGVGSTGLLFVDSTHAVKPGSEVNRLILEVLPRLSAGSFVHFHDIFFPFDYPRGLLADELFFWNESPLLHAFLVGNGRVTIRVSMSILHYDRPQELKLLLPNYEPQASENGLGVGRGHFPSSTYLEVIG